jgi:peptidoglycan/LPS O-acetylase OafA/YrhL
MKELKPLTTMRGFFALWVLAFHIEFNAGMPRGEPLISYGYLGVEFFFMLSGFILAGAYGEQFAQKWSFSQYSAFLRRRILRIFPLHWTLIGTLILYDIFTTHAAHPLSPLLSEFTLTQMWLPDQPRINGLDWSLSTELAVNIALPILAVLILSRSRVGRCLSALAAIAAVSVLIYQARLNGWTVDTLEPGPAMVQCLCEFSIGMVIFRLHRHVGFLSTDFALFVIGITLVTLVAARTIDLLMVAVMALGLCSLAGNEGRFKSILSAKPLHYLGKISFSIYLTQTVALRFARGVVGDMSPAAGRYWVFALLGVGGTLLLASLTHQQVELRFGGRSNRRSSRSRAPASDNASENAPDFIQGGGGLEASPADARM